ncbi:Putative AMP-dependent synthetase/ligase domain, phosphopantetheine binding ACP domain, AMP-binding [Colletotrichum destructivum]|uniref:AMP-dependent synthetase/ligase domain, phosphopantetheine binding ACP domain, AMP-binding n=1 Tax=Colletotrichum destructivum TaxID=34406 RepID=A0AAX4IUJ9_9PEZI|nr:Putative AMP-dependent synthetase/ligase domain, phosphopantetheine binding ACP domain, AMP-binding [Colletotrichum destructivum]
MSAITEPKAAAGSIRPFKRPAVNFESDKRLDGHLHSIPELIDFNATHNPSHPFCVQAKPTDPFDTVSHAEFKVAVSRCAAWLKQNLPLRQASGGNSAATKMAPVALFMESDVGLVIHEFALMSIGVPPLVLSARLPPAAINALMEATSAGSFIVSQRLSEPAKPALAALASKGISTHVANRYDAFYEPHADASSVPAFESPEDRNSVILLLHSSGTTGFPKPIPLTHRQLLFALNCHGFDTEEQAQGLNLSTLPLFHGFGLVAPGLSLSAGKPTLYPVSDGIPNAVSIIELVKKTKARSMMTVPFLLDAICDLPDDEGIKALAHMDFVGTGGAALGAGVGDKLAAGGVKLLNFYGTTEAGHLSLIFAPTDSYDWKYFRLRNDMKFTVAELEPRDGEKRFRLTVFPFGDGEGIEIADQLVRNEQYPETDFAAVGRDDDVIVLATGEKADPLILETMLSEAPAVKSAVAFGENQFNLGVIVEPREPLLAPADEEAFREKIWPIVTAAGQKMDASARVPSPDAIIVVPGGKVVPRTDKGSIARKETYALFDMEIKAVYERLVQAATESVGPLDLDNLEENIKALVHEHLRLQTPVSAWAVDDSLFDLGVDSLQALQLRRVLIAAASKTEGLKDVDVAKMIPSQFIYRNPSVREMAAAILQRSSGGGETDSSGDAVKEVNELVDQYSLGGASTEDEKQPSSADNAVVLLTGSSGSLGSHCVADLARRPQVRRIICLIRKEKGANAPPPPGGGPFDRRTLKARGLDLAEEEWSKIATLEVDPTAEKLGLMPMVYAAMQERVTHVVHAAWPMNYLIPLRSFRYQLQFLRSLLEFAAHGPGRTKRRLVFVSSIAAVAKIGLDNPGSAIPEAPVSPEEATCGIGYADGKLACEKIVERAAETYAGQLEVTSVRCGQITGAKGTGVWNTNEQIPMLLKSAQSLGSLPQLSGELSWIPVDDAASVISEIAFSPEPLSITLHLDNPTRQPWSDLMESFGKQLNLKPSVPFQEWLEQVAGAEQDDEKFPVKKLYAFFKHLFQPVACGSVVLDTSVAKTRSGTLRDLGAVDDATLHAYVKYWLDVGYLSR